MSNARPGDSVDPAPRSLLWAGQGSTASDSESRRARVETPARPVLGPEAFWLREFILTGPPPSKKYRQRAR